MTLAKLTPAEYEDNASISIVDELTQAIADMKATLEQETELLRMGKLHDALKLETQKSDCLERYTHVLKIANENKEHLQSQEIEKKVEIKQSMQSLNSALETNMQVLAQARDVTQELIEHTADYVNSKVGGASTYNATGKTQTSYGKSTKSIAISKEY